MTDIRAIPLTVSRDRPLAGVRCVVFDAVGTVIEPVPPAGEMYYQVARKHGSRISAEEIAFRFQRQFRETEWNDKGDSDEAGLVTSESIERERWRTIVTHVIDDVADTEACFEELFSHFARPASWRCFPDVPETIAALRQAGFKIALASNFDSRLHAVCNGWPALRDIDIRVISAEVGFRKPSRRFFEALRNATGCEASELFMVGDNRENDVSGARASGIAGILINRRGADDADSIRDLHELLAWI
jgi:putative hydrolase of the HAD superfamily